MRVVLDTNIIISGISARSPFHKVISSLLNKDYVMVVTNEIVLEYMEKLENKFGNEVSQLFFESMESLSNVQFIDRVFESKLIEADLDDNKFVDCAYAGNVNYLVTNDRHFDRVKAIQFPKLNIITMDEFINQLNKVS